jgi:caffeoyl-CoA O-methyltransferase
MVAGMIVTEAVQDYLQAVRPAADPVLAEMEEHGARDGIPIVSAETGRLLHVLALAAGARRVVEIGTAIGVSTLHLARALPPDGELVSFEIDAERRDAAQSYLERAGVADRVDLRLQDALEGLRELDGPFDLAFLDAAKGQYADYLDLTLPLLRPRGVVAVDNVLMSGSVAENRPVGPWSADAVAGARAFNERLLAHPELVMTVLPVGDGVAVGVRRPDLPI